MISKSLDREGGEGEDRSGRRTLRLQHPDKVGRGEQYRYPRDRLQTEETVVEVETEIGFMPTTRSSNISLHRFVAEDKPLKVEGVEVASVVSQAKQSNLAIFDREQTAAVVAARVMSRLQALYLREQGFSNVKVYRP